MAAVTADQRAPMGPLPPGARLGRYEILAKLAAGGMAIVYVARAHGVAGFERLVAIKVLHANLAHEEEFIKMFLDEARLAASIRHPNVVPTIDISDSEKSGYFIVMEYIEGDHLGQLLSHANKAGEKLPVAVTLRIVADALGGLGAAHDLCDETGKHQNLVHRDVSPHNIMVGRDGVARLTDFGVAKAEDRLTHTRDGQVKGKLAYMAPEQAASGTTDPRSDLFSMGVILWECLTGQRLMRAESTAATLHKLLHSEIPKPSSVDERLAPLDGVLSKALARDPEQRFQSAEEFATALEDVSSAFGMASLREVGKIVKQYAAVKLKRDKGLVEDALKALRPVEVSPIDDADLVEEVSSPSNSEISLVAAGVPNVPSKVSGVFANDTMPGTRRAGRRTLELSIPGAIRGDDALLAAPPPAGAKPVAPEVGEALPLRDSELSVQIELEEPVGSSLETDEADGYESSPSARKLRWAVFAFGGAVLALVLGMWVNSPEEDVRVERMPVSHAQVVHVIEPPKSQALMVGTVQAAGLAPKHDSHSPPSVTGVTRDTRDTRGALLSGSVGSGERQKAEPATPDEPRSRATSEDVASDANSPQATSATPGARSAAQTTQAPSAVRPARDASASVTTKPRVIGTRRTRESANGTARVGDRPALADVMPNPYHD